MIQDIGLFKMAKIGPACIPIALELYPTEDSGYALMADVYLANGRTIVQDGFELSAETREELLVFIKETILPIHQHLVLNTEAIISGSIGSFDEWDNPYR